MELRQICEPCASPNTTRSRVSKPPRLRLAKTIHALVIVGLLGTIWASSHPLFSQDSSNATPTAAPQAQDTHSAGAAALKAATRTSEMLSSYEGQNVSSIELAGRTDLDEARFTSAFQLRPGQPFSREKLTQTTDAVKAAGKFEEIRAQVDPQADGVRVLLVVQPAVYFGIFQFPGAGPFTYSRLVQVANFPVQTPFNAAEVERDRQSLLNFFRQAGFFQAEVRSEVKVDADHAIANVSFPVTLGRRANFGIVVFDGVPPAEQAKLQQSVKSVFARARTAAIRPGKPYHYSTLNTATKYLQAKLAKEGLLGAQVKLAGAEYHADTNRADIHFNIVPGPNIRVDIEGAHVWSWTRKALLPMYQGVGADDEAVQEGRQALASYFQRKGYFDAKVDADLKTTNAKDVIVYRITKAKKHKVDEVSLKGNRQVPASALEPHLAVEEKHFFSAGKFSDQLVRTSVNNLKAVYQSEGFSDVTIVPTVTNRSDNVDVVFRVTEGPRDIVSSLKVEGAETLPASQYAPNGLKLAVGQPYSQAHVQEDRTNIVAHYLEAGYLTSS